MTSKVKADEFLELVKLSGLVEMGELTQAVAGMEPPLGDSGIVSSTLIEAGLLTEWQTEKLLEGRHRGFFVGKYKVLDQLGSGGMGSVYLAQHRVMRHRVAIKVLPKILLAKDAGYLERFFQEARAAARLNHPNVVRAFDIDQEGEMHFLVMDYIAGEDLQKKVAREGPLEFRQAAEFARQAALGLAHAHGHGLVHRDVKPSNLIVDRQGTVKLLDLGLARMSDDESPSLTVAGGNDMLGTADYLSPEQALDSHGIDHRADIYSLGCTLYYLLTGKPPFPDGTLAQRIMNHQTARPSSIRNVRPDAPTELCAICDKMMAKKPAERHQSADDVAQALADWLGGPGTPHSARSAMPGADSDALDFSQPIRGTSASGGGSSGKLSPSGTSLLGARDSKLTLTPNSEIRPAATAKVAPIKDAHVTGPTPASPAAKPEAPPSLLDLLDDLPPAAPMPGTSQPGMPGPMSGLSDDSLAGNALPAGGSMPGMAPWMGGMSTSPMARTRPSETPPKPVWITIATGVVIGLVVVLVGWLLLVAWSYFS
jgi:serine/threonine protein kinase